MNSSNVTKRRRLTINDLPEDTSEPQCWTRFPKMHDYIKWYETEFTFAPFENPVDYVQSLFEVIDTDGEIFGSA